MKIRREVFEVCFGTPESMAKDHYEISFELGPDMEDDEGNEAIWFCGVFKGDSNGPWKKGTIEGSGYGMTGQEAYKKAMESLEIVTGYEQEKELPVKSRFSVFLADWKAKHR